MAMVIGLVVGNGGEQSVVGAVIVGVERIGRHGGKQLVGTIGILHNQRINSHERGIVGTPTASHHHAHCQRHTQYVNHLSHCDNANVANITIINKYYSFIICERVFVR